jgi:hypothetical protein
MTQYPNKQDLAAGALPVFIVPRPTWIGKPPSNQKDPESAIPVYFVAQPTTPGGWPNAQNDANAAEPVRVVAGLGTGHGSDQGVDRNAFPVWDAGGPPSPPFSDDPRSHNAAVPVWKTN